MHKEDHFSQQSAGYFRYRPHYPDGLFAYLATVTAARDSAWDCATGNGQAALGVAKHFQTVVASDASAAQINHGPTHPAVRYVVMTAEQPGIATGAVDLITVAQALHWFDIESFFPEAERVLKPGGVIATWCYRLLRVSAQVDSVVRELYDTLLGPYWPAERRLVDEGYASLPFPFAPLPTRPWQMTAVWTCQDLMGYLRTWSAVQRYQRAEGHDAVALVSKDLERAWGAETRREVRWPISSRVGRVG